ncbi:MAG: hypothetical protein ACRC35_13810 [Angustibacter sp.]
MMVALAVRVVRAVLAGRLVGVVDVAGIRVSVRDGVAVGSGRVGALAVAVVLMPDAPTDAGRG